MVNSRPARLKNCKFLMLVPDIRKFTMTLLWWYGCNKEALDSLWSQPRSIRRVWTFSYQAGARAAAKLSLKLHSASPLPQAVLTCSALSFRLWPNIRTPCPIGQVCQPAQWTGQFFLRKSCALVCAAPPRLVALSVDVRNGKELASQKQQQRRRRSFRASEWQKLRRDVRASDMHSSHTLEQSQCNCSRFLLAAACLSARRDTRGGGGYWLHTMSSDVLAYSCYRSFSRRHATALKLPSRR